MREGTVVGERFRVDRLAGVGGMGSVFRATDLRTGGAVALKVVRRADPERFAREAGLLASLEHPRVVRYVAHGTDGEDAWVAMAWLDGEDLAVRLARGPLAPADALAVCLQVAEGLAAVHARGAVHRDVKPSNVWLEGGAEPSVKLIDFGVARAGDAAPLTRAGAAIGTPGYMAPEQARGDADLGPAADVFSLGCVLFECLAGAPVFTGDHLVAILAKVLFQEAPRLSQVAPGVPAAVEALVARLLSKDPAARPPDGAAAAAALRALLEVGGAPDATLVAEPPTCARALGSVEAQLACVVLLGPDGSRDARGAREALRGLGDAFGAALEVLADGSVLAVLAGEEAARERATRAARLALALCAAMPGRDAALALGRAEAGPREGAPVGEGIDRATRLLGATRGAAAGVRVDDAVEGLLAGRFELEGGALLAERDADAARTVLGRPVPCVGRHAELGFLRGLIEGASAERAPGAALVVGPPGAGKSRLLHELALGLAQGGVAIQRWRGRGDPMRAAAPLGVLADAVGHALGAHGEAAPVARARLRARVSRSVAPREAARVAAFLAELLGLPLDDDAGRAAAPLAEARRDAQLMADQLRRAFCDFALAEAAREPVLLVLEDLHWGDAASVGFVDELLRVAAGAPLVVVATGRPDVRERFPSLWAAHDLRALDLGPLPRRAAERLVRALLPATNDEAVARVVARAEGNPLFCEEFARAQGDGRGDATPESVVAMVRSRFDALPEDARRLLRAGSAFGRTFWLGGAASLSGVSSLAAAATLHALAARELLDRAAAPRFAGEDEYAFRHDAVREAAYASLTDEDRRLAHRHAGGWLAERGEPDARVLADHFEQGAEPARAAAAYARAARQALEAGDAAEAVEASGRGVACGAVGVALGELLLLRSEAAFSRGDNAAATADAERALEALERGSSAWIEAAGLRATLAMRAGDGATLEAWARRLLAAEPGTPGAAIARLRAGLAVLFHGDAHLAAELAAPASRAGTGDEEPADAGVAYWRATFEAGLADFSGDAGRALARSADALRAAEAAGSERWKAVTRINLGYRANLVGAYETAERELARVLADEEARARDGAGAAAAGASLAVARARLGQLDGAVALARRSAAVFERQGDRRFEGGARTYLARLLVEAGKSAEAEREAARAVELLRDAGRPLVPLALAALAAARAAGGRATAALDAADEARRLLDAGVVEEGEGFVRLVHAEALHEAGDVVGARAAIAAARARLAAQAARISSEEHRRTFLARVPEHARTEALAAAWSGEPG